MSDITYTCEKPNCFHCYEMNRQQYKPSFKTTHWTPLEVEYLIANYKWKSIEKMSEHLNRSPSSIYSKKHYLNSKAA